ncbi:hypothetical protein [uncultured Dokdonia sp.]|uniref:hypothetical protein n=1 Tax=uncultured Dokdonia sp. TaxID=575653 RepID=UPI00261F088C|nr:hypothetical protein [uncultured Dokdonia sp.]
MKTTASKGIKPFILNLIIVTMSLLYVFAPVHVEVNKLLHAVSHSLEMPDYILTHQDTSGIHTPISTHESETHKNIIAHHDHKVIALLDNILEGANQNSDSSDAQTSTLKIDKHINNYTHNAKEPFEITFLETIQRFPEEIKRVCKGYLQGFRKPPKA